MAYLPGISYTEFKQMGIAEAKTWVEQAVNVAEFHRNNMAAAIGLAFSSPEQN